MMEVTWCILSFLPGFLESQNFSLSCLAKVCIGTTLVLREKSTLVEGCIVIHLLRCMCTLGCDSELLVSERSTQANTNLTHDCCVVCVEHLVSDLPANVVV